MAVLAEGLAHKLGDAEELTRLLGQEVPVDAACHPRLSQVPLTALFKDEITRRLARSDHSVTVVAHKLGYELRCAQPGSYDLSYCRDLGHGGVRLLLDNPTTEQTGVMVTIQRGDLVPVPFDHFVDPHTRAAGRHRQLQLLGGLRVHDPPGSGRFRITADRRGPGRRGQDEPR